jgi:outer membrane protein assembly factor BamA
MWSCIYFPLLVIPLLGQGTTVRQVPVPEQHTQVVEAVQIIGNHRLRREDILDLVRTRPNRPYNGEQVEADLRALLDSGLFDPERTFASSEETDYGSVVVTFEVYEWRVINEVHFDGFSADEISSIEVAFARERIHLRVGELLKSPELLRAYRVICAQTGGESVNHGNVTFYADVYPDHAAVGFTKRGSTGETPDKHAPN